MADRTYFLPAYICNAEHLPITPVLGAFLVSEDHPPLRGFPVASDTPQGMLPLTFWLDGHAVASRWFPSAAYKSFRTSPFFAEPVCLILLASLPTAAKGWMCVDVAAVSETHAQAHGLLNLREPRFGGVTLVHVGRGRIALPLGHHWIPLADEVADRLATADDDALDLLAQTALPAFETILYGDAAERAARLLESIPGIRGERV